MLLLASRNELSKKAFEPMSAGSHPNSRIPKTSGSLLPWKPANSYGKRIELYGRKKMARPVSLEVNAQLNTIC